ncbi:hypothetical protein FRC06_004741 [Ceratobasidium sp. 370]|nr:hypothetical protein FRC06_004741 [Ceratobasidium sp. 370]
MYFTKVLLVLAAFSASALGHSGLTPALGVQGKITRNQVQRPSTAKPCGTASLAALDTSTAVKLNGNTFTVTATNFNGGRDGSTQMTAQVDPTGKGTSFKPATVIKNGVLAPATTGDVQITVQMPAGVTCGGGAGKNKCLVSFKSAGNFGNCVVVQSGGAAASTNGAKAAAVKTANKKGQRRHARDFLASLEEKREVVKHAISRAWATRDAA